MKNKSKKQEDGTFLVTINHKGVIDTRIVNPILKDDGSVDKDKTETRIEEICTAVKSKIDMGLITQATVDIMKYIPQEARPISSEESDT